MKVRNYPFTLTGASPHVPVTIRQRKGKFLFGSNVFGLCRGKMTEEESALYRERILDIWNAGTLPFYWGRYEPTEGDVDAQNVWEAALWAKEKGLTLKGHPLCWHTVCADWLLEYDNDTILGKQLDRIRREVDRYKGVIDMWDVINETVIMPVFDRYDNAVTRLAKHMGTENLILACFKAAREANPKAKLLINDFDLRQEYADIIERLLDRGCSIDAIGLQTHQHEGYMGTDKLQEILARFERFGLPLHFTEITILSGKIAPKVDDLNDLDFGDWPSTPEGEQRQLEQMEEFYRTVFAHPLTEAMIWWDLRDGNWLNAPAGLIRRDMSPKPAYRRLREMIKKEFTADRSESSIKL